MKPLPRPQSFGDAVGWGVDGATVGAEVTELTVGDAVGWGVDGATVGAELKGLTVGNDVGQPGPRASSEAAVLPPAIHFS